MSTGSDPDIREIVQGRGIVRVLHFTTVHKGLTGILKSGAVKSRKRLPTDAELRYIRQMNTPTVKDAGWEDYVNLSVTDVNQELLAISAQRWHPGDSWCVLSFEPAILEHEGVVFATCNNAWPNARRRPGAAGLKSLFGETVLGRYTDVHTRDGLSDFQPTCQAAEVLYPAELDVDYLTEILVRSASIGDDVAMVCGLLNREYPIVEEPELFG